MVNTDIIIATMYQLKNKGVKYSMNGSRNGSDGTADCSGAISYALIQGGASNPGYLPSTETMHYWLTQNGYKLIAQDKEWQMQRGDIIIFGRKGQSAGAGGHVVIATDNVNVIHCNYSANGVSVNPETTLPYSMGWYVYRQSGQPTNKPTTSTPSTSNTGAWIKESGHFKLAHTIALRKSPSTSAPLITNLSPGSVVKYDAYAFIGEHVWIRQPRGGGYAYMATGRAQNGKRVDYWGSFY